MDEDNANDSPERLKSLEDRMEGLQDNERLTELDIINLKNEIEKIKIGATAYVPEDLQEKISKLEKIAESAEIFEKWKETIKEVNLLREKILNWPASASYKLPEPLDYKKDIEEIKAMASESKMPADALAKLEEMSRRLDEIDQRVRSIKPARIPQIPEGIEKHPEIIRALEERLNAVASEIGFLKSSLRQKGKEPSGEGAAQEIMEKFESLKNEVNSLKKSAPATENLNSEELEMKIAAIFSRVERIEKQKEYDFDIDDRISYIEGKIEEFSERAMKPPAEDALNSLKDSSESLRKEIASIKARLKKIAETGKEDKLKAIVDDLSLKVSNLNSDESSKRLELIEKSIALLEKKIKSEPTKKKKDDALSSDIKKIKSALLALENKAAEYDAILKSKEVNEKAAEQIGYLQKDIESLKSSIGLMVSKKDLEEFEAGLIPPRIPESAEIEEALKKGAELEKEIKAISSRSKDFEKMVKKVSEIDKLKDGISRITEEVEKIQKGYDDKFFKNVAEKTEENSKRIENLLTEFSGILKEAKKPAPMQMPLPPQRIPESFLKEMRSTAEGLEYLRKLHLTKEAEYTKNFAVINSKIEHNARLADGLMKEISEMMKNMRNMPLPQISSGKDMKVIEGLVKEMDSVKSEMASMIREKEISEFENEIYREMESLNRTVKEILTENGQHVKKLGIEISDLSERVKSAEKAANSLGNLNADGIQREIERLKAKQEFLEGNIHHIDLNPLHEKISEIERRVNAMRVSSPLIIE